MRKHGIIFRLISLCAALLLIPALPVQAADDYTQSLISAGFPADYAEKLAKLHKAHPSWTFEPLDVTGLSDGKYTWAYVINQETDAEPKRSLVANSDSYVTLRDFTSSELYDSGWWKASAAAVEYMMDPRNFLDEKEIFQFYDLAWSDTVTLAAVQAAVRGTFMENAKLDGIYSDMTYAEFFMKAGKELGASPVYLAARIRNEQGVNGTSPLISGKCGDTMWDYYDRRVSGSENGQLINAPSSGYNEETLKEYNGYYNYFNIGASGTGYFSIYLGGMKEAKNGTAALAAEWGGSPSWDTRWKAIYGGAYTATNKYILDYQNTSYLQKFNVDPRSSRNFWGQYMQSIHGSAGQAATFYKSFSENGMLDLPYNFLIPVFEGMPEECPYPDGTGFANKKYISAANVEVCDIMDISDIPEARKNYTAEKISWRVLVTQGGAAVSLGRIDLSRYSGVCIEYSVAAKFDCFADRKKAFLGLVCDMRHLYGTTDGEADLSCDMGHANIADGTAQTGFLQRRVVNIDLSSAAVDGEIFLTPFMQKGQKIIIHNIAFITKSGYEAPAPETYVPVDADEDPSAADTGDAVPASADTAYPEENSAQNAAGRRVRTAAAVVGSLCAAAALCTAAVVIAGKRGKER